MEVVMELRALGALAGFTSSDGQGIELYFLEGTPDSLPSPMTEKIIREQGKCVVTLKSNADDNLVISSFAKGLPLQTLLYCLVGLLQLLKKSSSASQDQFQTHAYSIGVFPSQDLQDIDVYIAEGDSETSQDLTKLIYEKGKRIITLSKTMDHTFVINEVANDVPIEILVDCFIYVMSKLKPSPSSPIQ
jgi:hypothetical protein